ncbi:palmitoyltransferase akr1 isoform X1 [Hypomesus transpacificus]|uniref:palmitoyltransferase akr1 isoform X1 n=1 Tax=Hypomesus transpacificus TaxID=137520 RepID=UPI001F07A74C|nr:palmitoyltransferase akr1 isoform X1 [Hypomesus transpacificus]
MLPLPAGCSDDEGDIFDSIQRGNIEQCAHFIQLDRSVLKHKGWGGFTPLHVAALHGNRAMVDLVLSNGADPNLTCDAGQTAFHFACRQGNVYVMHQMMQHGADLRIVDLQGKTALHHAVSGGSIVSVHYLWETGMFRFSDGDMYQVTPLHLAASTGNTEVVRYLLREQGSSYLLFQRCSVDAVDQQGATALHVAAERGAVEVCWTLLQRAGYRLLHIKNYNGLTPLDLSRQGKTFRHQQLTKLLSQYIREPMHQKPQESHILYYWTVLFPSLSGAAILLVASMLGGYGGLVCSLLFPWLARSIFTQFHRMTTYQRLPNPVYLGTLIAGLFHSLLCFYGKIIPSVWPASGLMHVSVVHFSLVLVLFWKVLIQDPGTLGPGDADPRFSGIADLVENNENPQRFCIYCELFQPDHTKHCKLCDVCVRDYDHHCLFLNCCVGQGNHRLFLVFILSMVTAHLFFVAVATRYLYVAFVVGGWSLSSGLSVLGTEFWVVVMATLNAFTLLWEAWLLTEQFDAIAMGTTTYFRQCETSMRQRSLGQRLMAVLIFLLEGRQRVGRGLTEQDSPSIDI